MKAELDGKITKQQGKEKTPVWHCGEHLREFLEEHPQYEDLISTDLDNPEMSLKKFETAIKRAANSNGGGLGGKAADAVLRSFFGLPKTDAPDTLSGTTKTADLPFDFSGGLW